MCFNDHFDNLSLFIISSSICPRSLILSVLYDNVILTLIPQTFSINHSKTSLNYNLNNQD